MQCFMKRCGLFLKITCFLCSIYLVVNYLLLHSTRFDLTRERWIPSIDFRASNVLKSSKHQDREKVIYIINLHKWRKLILKERVLSTDNRTKWCDVPKSLLIISNSICRMYLRKDCTRLPCHMIYTSPNTVADIKCFPDGKVMKNNLDNSQEKLLCKSGYSLDLFLKTSNDFAYPSIIADVSLSSSKEFYTNVLNKKFRSPSSVWSLYFNFESIINYPSAANRKLLKLFNVSFGYDRSIYDFIPHPWLFGYVRQLIHNSTRLSIEKAMENKKPIHTLNSNLYWTNTQTLFLEEEKANSSSSVTAPILWMNSNCRTASKRTEYMLELMKYIEVDNYGTCGTKILNLPKDIIEIQNSKNRNLKKRGSYKWQAGKLELSKRYLFTIAIENSITHDYITEKLWHPLIVGSVPLYLGAPNVQDWLPCKTNCIIDLRKFPTVKDAAKYIKSVAMNQTLYEQYHKWRNETVSDKFQKILRYFKNIGDCGIDCILCKISSQVKQGYDVKQIKRNITALIGRF